MNWSCGRVVNTCEGFLVWGELGGGFGCSSSEEVVSDEGEQGAEVANSWELYWIRVGIKVGINAETPCCPSPIAFSL